jgi:hypothetical protein
MKCPCRFRLVSTRLNYCQMIVTMSDESDWLSVMYTSTIHGQDHMLIHFREKIFFLFSFCHLSFCAFCLLTYKQMTKINPTQKKKRNIAAPLVILDLNVRSVKTRSWLIVMMLARSVLPRRTLPRSSILYIDCRNRF